MVDLEEYEKLRKRPNGLLVMYQKWRDLSFLHFPIEPAALRPLVPEELEIDTFAGQHGDHMAWVGLIPFWMTGVRPRGLPPIPGFSTFPETNLRTYVHREGKKPGVWFFTLEASNRVACNVARATFGLPYHWARMKAERTGDVCNYQSVRHGQASAVCNVSTKVGEPLGTALPGTLEFFLVERYLLYSKLKGTLVTGQVHHVHYPLYKCTLDRCEETLTKVQGIEPRPWKHFCYSPGVDVEIYAPT